MHGPYHKQFYKVLQNADLIHLRYTVCKKEYSACNIFQIFSPSSGPKMTMERWSVTWTDFWTEGFRHCFTPAGKDNASEAAGWQKGWNGSSATEIRQQPRMIVSKWPSLRSLTASNATLNLNKCNIRETQEEETRGLRDAGEKAEHGHCCLWADLYITTIPLGPSLPLTFLPL